MTIAVAVHGVTILGHTIFTVTSLNALTAMATRSQTTRLALRCLQTDADRSLSRFHFLGETCAQSTLATVFLLIDTRHPTGR